MKTVTCALTLFLLAGSSASAGLIMVRQNGETESTTYIEGNKMLFEDPDGRHIGIFDDRAKVLTVINITDRTYSQASRADMKAMGAVVEKARTQMRASLDQMTPEARQVFLNKMTPEQRRWYETPLPPGAESAAVSGSAADHTRYEPTGEKSTVAGFTCEWYRETQGDGPPVDECLIPWRSTPVSKHDLRPVQGMIEFFRSGLPPRMTTSHMHMRRTIAAVPGLVALRKPSSEEKEWERLISIERRSVPADKFSPPPGYTKSAKGPFGADDTSPDAASGR